ncbi:MAG: hypothetical protein IPK72_08810 [Candidatus Eisenbacteria bacterium]|nr:hypothetical protein [Candidatus Eisenbacteria bacterium]
MIALEFYWNALLVGTLSFSSKDSDTHPYGAIRMVVDDRGDGTAFFSHLSLLKSGTPQPNNAEAQIFPAIPAPVPAPSYTAEIFGSVFGDPVEFTMATLTGVTYTP